PISRCFSCLGLMLRYPMTTGRSRYRYSSTRRSVRCSCDNQLSLASSRVMTQGLVTFVWTKGNTGRVYQAQVPHAPGKSLKQYLHENPLKQYSLLSLVKVHRIVNASGTKIKLTSIPESGGVVVFQHVARG